MTRGTAPGASPGASGRAMSTMHFQTPRPVPTPGPDRRIRVAFVPPPPPRLPPPPVRCASTARVCAEGPRVTVALLTAAFGIRSAPGRGRVPVVVGTRGCVPCQWRSVATVCHLRLRHGPCCCPCAAVTYVRCGTTRAGATSDTTPANPKKKFQVGRRPFWWWWWLGGRQPYHYCGSNPATLFA